MESNIIYGEPWTSTSTNTHARKTYEALQTSEQAQRFLSAFESLNAPFRLRGIFSLPLFFSYCSTTCFHLWNKVALAALVA
jgi:hypothetical protein